MPLQVTGTFSANGNSAPLLMEGKVPELGCKFNLSLSGLTSSGATVTLQRSFDGSTWKNVQAYTSDIETYGYEPAKGVTYQLVCTGYGPGPINYGLGF